METTYNYSPEKDLLTDSLETPVTYAGFWPRVGAYIIDGIILFAVRAIINSLVDIPMFGGLESFSSPFYYVDSVADILYFVLMESSGWQATLGKKAVGIIVTDLDGNRIGFGRALGRYFARILSAVTLCIGFIMAGFTEKKQCLHDMICSTLVVKR